MHFLPRDKLVLLLHINPTVQHINNIALRLSEILTQLQLIICYVFDFADCACNNNTWDTITLQCSLCHTKYLHLVVLQKYNYLRSPRYELLYNEVSKYQYYQNHKHLIRTNATSPINQFVRCK